MAEATKKADAVKVLRAWTWASGVPCPHAGQFVAAFDANAYDGRGFADFTPDIAKAKKFPDAAAALAFWKTQSTVKPFRPDGRPNRPLTALSVVVEDA